MKIIKNGEKVEMTYEQICEELGNYTPSINFVEVTSQGRIGFTAGKPREVKDLYKNAINKGFLVSDKLKNVIKVL